MLVRWNEPYQKLATCDVTGIIFVWIKHDGRWSIELINDRSSQVRDFITHSVDFNSVSGTWLPEDLNGTSSNAETPRVPHFS